MPSTRNKLKCGGGMWHQRPSIQKLILVLVVFGDTMSAFFDRLCPLFRVAVSFIAMVHRHWVIVISLTNRKFDFIPMFFSSRYYFPPFFLVDSTFIIVFTPHSLLHINTSTCNSWITFELHTFKLPSLRILDLKSLKGPSPLIYNSSTVSIVSIKQSNSFYRFSVYSPSFVVFVEKDQQPTKS